MEQRLGELIDPTLRRMGIRSHVREAQVRRVFGEVVGEAVAPLCRAVALEHGGLLVATSHPALAHQLQMESPRLIDALNARLGAVVVRRLRFTTLDAAPGRG